MSGPKTTIVVVTYNARRTIGALIEALEPAKDRVRLVVADNMSADGTLALVRDEHPWVVAESTGANLGFGRGCNAGFEYYEGSPYVLFLNPDAVMQPQALERLERFLDENPKAGICAPAIREGDDLQVAGMVTTPASALKQAVGLPNANPTKREITPGAAPFRTNWVCGAALMIRSHVFKALGGFDPRFFMYFEETDLCVRAAQRGWEIWGVGEAVIEHEGAGTAREESDALVSGCIPKYYFESRYYYLTKHFGLPKAAAVEAAELALLAARKVAKRALGKRDSLLEQRVDAPLFRAPNPER